MSGDSDRPRVVALLFGRAGSVGLPGKNVMRILGRPSVHYPLMGARASGIVDEIYVSSDSEEIFELARPFNVREIRRPAYLATNEALLEDAIFHAFEFVETLNSSAHYYLILLGNSVTVLPERIREAYEILNDEPLADSVATGSKLNMFSPVRARRLDSDAGTLKNYVPLDVLKQFVNLSCDRDKSEDCVFCDNSFTLVRRESLARLHDNEAPFKWMGNRIRFIEQLPGGGDIDCAWQVPVVEWWLRKHGFSAEKEPFFIPKQSDPLAP